MTGNKNSWIFNPFVGINVKIKFWSFQRIGFYEQFDHNGKLSKSVLIRAL